MSIIEKIVGVLPTVRDRARTVLDFAMSTKGKVILALAAAVIALGYAHHRGVESQEPRIAQLSKELGEVKKELGEAKLKAAMVVQQPAAPSPKVQSWLEEQARVNEQLDLKVKTYEKELAKRPAGNGDRLTDAESRRLLDIR